VKTVILVSLCTCLGLVPAIPAMAGQISRPAAPVWTGSYLGVMLQEIDSERAKALKLPEEAGVEITRVEPDSPADKAGVKTGDVALEYNGQRVEGMEQFSRLVHETPPGREAKLVVSRNGAPQTLMVKVGARRAGVVGTMAPPMPPERFDIHVPDMPRSVMSWRSSMLGVEVESLESQLAQYFGVKEGVLVRAVIKGSVAEKAGIKAGDVITRVGDSKVATPADVSSRIRAGHGAPISVGLMRDHKEMTLTISVDDDQRGSLDYPLDPAALLAAFTAA
jgi:serine protease Do